MGRRKETRRAARRNQDGEALNLVAMIDMFTVLVFFLLITSTQILFIDTRAFGLTLPGAPTADAATPAPQRIEIVVRHDAIEVGDSVGGLIATVRPDDLLRLRDVLVELKRRAPTERKVSVLAEAQLPYQALVSVLDHIRAYPAQRGAERVQVELFPEIAMGDAPPRQEARST